MNGSKLNAVGKGEAQSWLGQTGRERMCGRKNPDGVVQWAAEEKGLGGVWGRTSIAEL